jgi:acetyl esterase/lipase
MIDRLQPVENLSQVMSRANEPRARVVRDISRIVAALALLAFPSIARAQDVVIPLYPGVAPGSESWTQREIAYRDERGEAMVRNVVRPTLTAYLPAKGTASGAAMIVAPGGGFRWLSWQSEGTQVAEWLQSRGIAAFVLRYRLANTGATEDEFKQASAKLWAAIGAAARDSNPANAINLDADIASVMPLAIADGREAVRLVRRRAAEWAIAPGRIGLMGFSAGAMVTVGVALEHDASSRPDVIAPIYAVQRMPVAVPSDAPPLFDVVAADDALAGKSSVALYSAWRAAGKPAELHAYARGGHGFGMHRQGLPVDAWIERLGEWLQDQRFIHASR